jgi:predicted dehydrogenase
MIQDMANKLRAGIVGCGRIASSFESALATKKPHSHAGAYASHPEIDFLAGCDIDDDARIAFEKMWSVKSYNDYIEMIEDNQLEIISICTPPETHKEVILDILKNCKSTKMIWCEKPLAQSPADCEIIEKACKDANVSITVNTWRRWDKFHSKIKETIDSGEIGDVFAIECKAHVGLMNTCTHLFDLLSMYTDSTVENVCGKVFLDSSCDPGAVGILEFKNGVVAFLDNIWKKDQVFGAAIFGTNGTIEAFSNTVLLQEFTIKTDDGETTVKREDFCYPSPMLSAVRNIVDHLKNGDDLLCTAYDAISAIDVVSAIYASHENQTFSCVPADEKFRVRQFKSRLTSLTRSGKVE